MVRTTTALTIFNAGDKDNVLPGKAEASVNFRLLPGDTQGSVIDHVRSTIANDRISIKPFPGNTDPPPLTATSSPSFQMLNRIEHGVVFRFAADNVSRRSATGEAE